MPAGSEYTLREVLQILRVPRGLVMGFVEAGFAHPQRGAHNQYRFSFADLIALRAAQDLVAARLPTQRILRALRKLRTQLPEQLPKRGLRIEAAGDAVVVAEGQSRWRADSGQYVLAFGVATNEGHVRFLDAPPPPAPRATTSRERDETPRAAETSKRDQEDKPSVARARTAFERAVRGDPQNVGAYINLGCALHEATRLADALSVYQRGLREAGQDPLLLFNLGVLLEDLERPEEAADAYRTALKLDPALADAHYNLALLYEAMGRGQGALRHLNAYRQLQE